MSTAVHRLRASGEAYVRFAVEHPGQFQVAFCRTGHDSAAPRHEHQAAAFGLLRTALDELVPLGLLTARTRDSAEYVAWAMVHGLAQLSLSGPLADMLPKERDALVEKALHVLTGGLRLASDGDSPADH